MDVREKLSSGKRLIDADAMKRVYQEVLCSHVACIDCSFFMDDKYCRFETMLSEAPTINDIPVVRCRECNQGEIDDPDFPDEYYCHAGCGWNKGDFYCAYGERKEV